MKKINSLILFGLVNLFVCCNGQEKKSEKAAEITPADSQQTSVDKVNLPAPYATKSHINLSKVIGWHGTKPQAPEGFKVDSFGKNLKSPRWIYVLPNGDVLVAQTKKEQKGPKKVIAVVSGQTKSESRKDNMNDIILLRDKNNDGIVETQEVFLSGLNMPFGMLLIKDKFYVACTDTLWCFNYKTGETHITSPGKKIIALPMQGRHWTRGLLANADGSKIYISVGSTTNVADDGIEKEAMHACILEINPDGSGERVYASGLRNPAGMAWMPGTSTLWTAVNERDELGDDLVPDYLTSVKDGGFYGWPYSYYGQHLDPRIKEKDQRPDLVQKAIVPDVELGAHTASLGLCFYNKKSFPAKYSNGAFIGQHGSWNREIPTGYKVVFVPFTNKKPGAMEDFLTGFMADEKKNEVYGRPVGVTLMNDGSLLVADDAGNMVWRVSHSK